MQSNRGVNGMEGTNYNEQRETLLKCSTFLLQNPLSLFIENFCSLVHVQKLVTSFYRGLFYTFRGNLIGLLCFFGNRR